MTETSSRAPSELGGAGLWERGSQAGLAGGDAEVSQVRAWAGIQCTLLQMSLPALGDFGVLAAASPL